MLGLLAGIALSVFFNSIFHSESTIKSLSQQSAFNLPEFNADLSDSDMSIAETKLSNVYSFFNRTEEVMAMYLLMLFGLSLAKKV
jgi:hypothetical protein